MGRKGWRERVTYYGYVLCERLVHGRVELELGLAALRHHRALDLEHADVVLRLQRDLNKHSAN